MSPEESGSNKRPRLDDDPWMCYLDSLDDAYEKLISTDFPSTMIHGSTRAERLLQSERAEINGQLIAKLEELIAPFADLLTLVTKWGTEATYEERLMLVHRAEQILVDWEGPRVSANWRFRFCLSLIRYPWRLRVVTMLGDLRTLVPDKKSTVVTVTKRSHEEEEGSDKRTKVCSDSDSDYVCDSDEDDDDDHETWEYLSPKEGYKMLTSKNFFSRMVRGRYRVERLLLNSQMEPVLDPMLIERLEVLEGYFIDLLDLKRNLGTKNDAIEKSRLMDLTKQILPLWEEIENVLPQPKPNPLSRLRLAPVEYPEAVPSAWLFERNWRDKAYEEILLLRKKYSYVLDQEYRESYTAFMKKKGLSGSALGGWVVLACKKLLKLVACSREDIDFMSVKRCFKRVMRIKENCIATMQSPHGTQKLTDQTQLPNWRDEIYSQIESSRKMYSLKLDELLRDEVKKVESSATLDACSIERQIFLEESLQFLANCRDGVVLHSEEFCRKQLAAIKQFMEKEDEDSPPAAKQETPSESLGQNRVAKDWINWRDFEYDVLQTKRLRFTYELYDVYLRYQPVWSKMPAYVEELKKVESHMKRHLEFYTMSRGDMAVAYELMDDYHNKCWRVFRKEVQETFDVMKVLVGCLGKEGAEPTWYCPVVELIPKGQKMRSRLLPKKDGYIWLG